MTLTEQFEAAQAASKTLTERPGNLTLLRLYGLFKQGAQGDNTTERPGAMDFVGRAKWDAWDSLRGTSPDEAQQQYIDLVDELKNA